MLYGAAGAGCRVLHLLVEPGHQPDAWRRISYMAGAELPVVIVNIMRGGPGLGGILPSQSDYFQATKGGGHGDYRVPGAGALHGAGGGRPDAWTPSTWPTSTATRS